MNQAAVSQIMDALGKHVEVEYDDGTSVKGICTSVQHEPENVEITVSPLRQGQNPIHNVRLSRLEKVMIGG